MTIKQYFKDDLKQENVVKELYELGILEPYIYTEIETLIFNGVTYKSTYLTPAGNLLFICVFKNSNHITINTMLLEFYYVDFILKTGYSKYITKLRQEIDFEHEINIDLQNELLESRLQNIKLQELGQVTFQFN